MTHSGKQQRRQEIPLRQIDENNLPQSLTGMADTWNRLDELPSSLAAGLNYAKGMHNRPLEYYVARVRKLGLQGKRVLDAGCGTGTWSFALRAAFAEVLGIDVSAERIGVAKWIAARSNVSGVEFRNASVLETGLPDASFDAIFCYGVLISAIPVEVALKEFYRILKPGGAVYVCLNGIGWSLYLRDERGKADPKIAEMGRQGIYNTLVHALPEREVAIIRGSAPDAIHASQVPLGAARVLLSIGSLGKRARTILNECGLQYFIRFSVDVAGLAFGRRSEFSHVNAGRGYLPVEVEAACGRTGLIDFQWACEGLISGSTMTDAPKPMYEGYFNGHLKVWEFLAFKPDDNLADGIKPEWFRLNAQRAARLDYLASARMPILTNVDAATCPRGWVEEARRRAKAAGGNRLIAALAKRICAGARNDEDCVERLIIFAQDALVHHPFVQPFEFNGAAVTDPATLLFLGIGRCGAAAPLVAALCDAVGISARVERVPAHVFAVAEMGGEELLLETDIFKKGIVPSGDDGKLLRYAALCENPRIADGLPEFYIWWATHLRNATDIWGRKPFGYAKTDDQFRVYSSFFVQDAACRLKPKVPVLTASHDGHTVHLSWTDATPADRAAVQYRVVARSASRGWNYDIEPANMTAILTPPPAQIEQWVESTSLTLTASEDTYFDVTPRLKERPDVFCWPSNEIRTASMD